MVLVPCLKIPSLLFPARSSFWRNFQTGFKRASKKVSKEESQQKTKFEFPLQGKLNPPHGKQPQNKPQNKVAQRERRNEVREARPNVNASWVPQKPKWKLHCHGRTWNTKHLQASDVEMIPCLNILFLLFPARGSLSRNFRTGSSGRP